MYKADGSLFIGIFSHGTAQGDALLILPDGSYYQGMMKDNTAECSNGIYQCPSYIYKGSFRNNHFDG